MVRVSVAHVDCLRTCRQSSRHFCLPYKRQKRPYRYGKRGLHIWQKRPTYIQCACVRQAHEIQLTVCTQCKRAVLRVPPSLRQSLPPALFISLPPSLSIHSSRPPALPPLSPTLIAGHHVIVTPLAKKRLDHLLQRLKTPFALKTRLFVSSSARVRASWHACSGPEALRSCYLAVRLHVKHFLKALQSILQLAILQVSCCVCTRSHA